MAEEAPTLSKNSFWDSLAGFLWGLLPRWLQRPLKWIARYLAERFAGVARSEGWGYLVWGVVFAAIAVPEIWAAAAGSNFIWPTISGTVGHLEDKWAIVALAPVALLAGAALALSRFQTAGVTIQADAEALVRTPEGRLAKVGKVELGLDKPVPKIVLDPASALAGRTKWSVLPYLLVASTVVAVCSLAAAASNNKWLTGYVLYSLIAVFGMVIPNALAYWRKKDVPFTTLFFTLRSLERRLHAVAIVIAAGLAVLLIHLAVYPWPDLARESAGHAGLTPRKAREAAEAELQAEGAASLQFSTQQRGVVDGKNVWFVYFLPPHGGYTGCVVTVRKKDVRVPAEKCAD